jgi:lysozyme family protein
MATFDIAIKTVLNNEGGYVNDPLDAGGETNFGISKRSFPNVDIKGLTQTQAAKLYQTSYWTSNPQLAKIQDQAVATKTLDLMVNMGSARGIKILQASINEVAGSERNLPVDGKLGPMTVARANEIDATELLKEMQDNAARHYCSIARKRPTQRKFLRGWLLRAYDRPHSKKEPTPACPE